MQPHPRPLRLAWLCALLTVAIAAAGCSRSAHDRTTAGTRPSPGVERPADAPPAATEPAAGGEPQQAAHGPSGPPPIAVMIDNFPGAARPQVGLDRADVVYELLVEGGVTRFVAVYAGADADLIRPVRSARTPAVLLAREWGAVLAHVGAAAAEGDADAVRLIAEWQVHDLDGDVDGVPFWREDGRPVPHNMATSTHHLRARAEELGWKATRLPSGPPRSDAGDRGPTDGPGRFIAYNFALDHTPQPASAASWDYGEEANAYRRSMAGRPHNDGATGVQLAVSTVVIQLHRAAVVSSEGHVVYEQVGEGRALIFRDGSAIDVTWRKAGLDEPTRYWRADGTEAALGHGRVWIALLPEGSPLSWR